MKERKIFAEGLGAGAAVVLAMTAATCLWQGNRIAGWLSRENEQMRQRRDIERAQQSARLSPDFLDACRAAGI